LKVRPLKLIILIVILATLTLVWFEGEGPVQDDFRIENTLATGTSDLRTLNVQPMNQSLQGLAMNTTKIQNTTILLLAPRIPYSTEEAQAIRQILVGGGVVIISDNFGVGNTLLAALGAPVRFGNVTILDDIFFEGTPTFPIAYNLSSQIVAGGVNDLALNTAAPLQILNSSSAIVLASTSPFSYLDMNSNGQRDPNETAGPFPVLARVAFGQGVLYVFSSPGSFTNGMLSSKDNARLLQTISGGGAIILDESHLETSPSTDFRLTVRKFFEAISSGTLDQLTKVSIASIAAAGILVWSMSPKIQEELTSRRGDSQPEREPKTIEEILTAHPTWKRSKLEYLEKEAVITKRRWRSAVGEGT